ncbi:OmpA family protein [Nonlabens sp. YIK11]|uniref:OmpA family protein n=1 Tax=Nonlabens sp. YIK11 TaxID=1453349 RepID=UPI000A7304A4|nr:OmpA family protein [Nonlabens sp. YIK11]
MKTSIKWLCLLALLSTSTGNAQFFKKLKTKIDKKLKQTEQKIEKKVDKGIDDLLFSTDSSAIDSEAMVEDDVLSNSTPDSMDMNQENPSNLAVVEAYSAYDFVPGSTIKAVEDFSGTDLGDFPSNWNSNAGAEVVELNSQPGRWLKIGNGSKTLVMNDIVNNWEEDFTLEFDIAHDFPQQSAFKRHFDIILSDLKDANSYLTDAYEGKAYTYLRIGAGGGSGYGAQIYKKATTKSLNASSKTSYDNFYAQTAIDRVHHVSIVKKGLRLKMYINGDKVIDMVRALDPAVNYTTLRFGTNISPNDQHFYVSNFKYAGDVEIPESLFENGSFQAHGITFESGTTMIKPESAGVLKRLAQEMQQSAASYQIIGHTDSDGDQAMNQVLSEQRAQVVKDILVQNYSIKPSRLSTAGMGEMNPISNGTTLMDKAKNRRVEIKKI